MHVGMGAAGSRAGSTHWVASSSWGVGALGISLVCAVLGAAGLTPATAVTRTPFTAPASPSVSAGTSVTHGAAAASRTASGTGAPAAAPVPGAERRAGVSGVMRTVGSGRVLVSVSSDARRVLLTWRTATGARHATVMAIRQGRAEGFLPKGSHSIYAQAKKTSGLRASQRVAVLPAGSKDAVLGPVTGLKVVGATATSISLSWGNPRGRALAGIVVRRASGGQAPTSPTEGTAVTLGAPIVKAVTDQELVAGATYSYSVFAADAAGNPTTPATVTAQTTAPDTAPSDAPSAGAPVAAPVPGAERRAGVSGVMRTVGSGRVLVSVSSDARRVLLTWRTATGARHATVMAIRQGRAEGFLPKGSHSIYAQAKKTSGLRASRRVAVLPAGSKDAVLGPVTGLKVVGATATSISLSWGNPRGRALAGIVVRRASGGQAPTSPTEGTAVTLGAPIVKAVTDQELVAGATYSYAVFAADAAGNPTTPATVTAQTTAPDTAPSDAPSAGAPDGPGVDVVVSGPLTRADVPYSYRPGCPVEPQALRRMSMNYWDYAGKVARGTLIVRADVVADLQYVFARAFDAGFRIKQMVPTDAFYDEGRRSPLDSDVASMGASNTSAFNCRPVVGNPTKPSAHSFGIAIDINPFENPYVAGGAVHPRGSGAYLQRAPCRTGMICPGHVVAVAMVNRGWGWGARWPEPDYQHFSANGR